MLKKLLMLAAISAVTVSAFAVDQTQFQIQKSIELKDGSTIHVFKGGKMGMEDKYGHAAYMESGQLMETKDGKKIIMNGNEVARVEQALNWNQPGG